MSKNLPKTIASKKANHWGSLIILSLAFIYLTLLSWGKWGNPIVDFGREVYLPWQILEGKILYRDLAYMYGPLSPYLNAGWFVLFGLSLSSIFIGNLILLICLSILIYFTFFSFTNEITATMITLFFLAMSGFPQIDLMGIFNFISPYCHSITHGIFFSILMIWFYRKHLICETNSPLFLAGFCLGLVFLTKPEIFVPALLTSMIALFLLGKSTTNQNSISIRALFVWITGASIPILCFFLFFLYQGDPIFALKATGGAFMPFFKGANLGDPFIMAVLGFNDFWNNLGHMFLVFFIFIGMVCFLIALETVFQNYPNTGKTVGIFLGGSVYVYFFLNFNIEVFDQISSFLPITSLSICFFLFYLIFKSKDKFQQLFPLLLWNIFSFLLLQKIILSVRLYHYGFVLAMPSCLFLLAILLYFIPSHLKTKEKQGELFYWFFFLSTLTLSSIFIRLSNTYYPEKTLKIGTKTDFVSYFNNTINFSKVSNIHHKNFNKKNILKIIQENHLQLLTGKIKINTIIPNQKWKLFDKEKQYLVERQKDFLKVDFIWSLGSILAQLLKFIDKNISPQATINVLPEGVMINYLSRRKQTTPYYLHLPLLIGVYGEENILKAFQENPSDYVILLQRDMSEYGQNFFGEDIKYGKRMMDWVKLNYKQIKTMGTVPFVKNSFGLIIYKRKSN